MVPCPRPKLLLFELGFLNRLEEDEVELDLGFVNENRDPFLLEELLLEELLEELDEGTDLKFEDFDVCTERLLLN